MTVTAANVALKRRQVRRMRAAGLTVVEVQGWETRGRPQRYDPLGVLEHHDASSLRSGELGALPIIVAGRTGIPGPLSQWQVGRSGTWYLVAAGRANHAGAGGPHGEIPADSGNRYLEGVEVANDGRTEPYSPALRRSLDIGLACLLTEIRGSLLSRITSWLLGHREWAPGRKSDPRHSMDWRRQRLRTVLARWTAPTTTPAPAQPAPATPDLELEDDMAARIKKKDHPTQYLVTFTGGAVPISDLAELQAWEAAGLEVPPLKVVPDQVVDELVAAAAARR